MADTYMIAYSLIDGTGFSKTEPFVIDGFVDLESACLHKKDLIRDGYKDVTIFKCNKDAIPEYFSWEYIISHIVN